MADITPSDSLVQAATANPLQGLANSINQYMGGQLQAQQDVAKQKQIIDYQTERDAAKQSAEEQRQLALEKQKAADTADTSQYTPDMAEAAITGAGAMITGFQKANGRMPTVDEGVKILKTHPQSSGLGKDTDASTYATLLKNSGVDDTENPFLGVKGPVPTGVATAMVSNKLKGGLSDNSILSLYKEVNPASQNTDPKKLGEDFQTFATAMKEPGKVPITNDAEMETTAKKAEGYVQKQMQQYVSQGLDQGKAYSKALADAAQVASKYDRKSKTKLLFRIAADTKQQLAQGQPQAAPAQPQQPMPAQIPQMPTMNRGIPQ